MSGLLLGALLLAGLAFLGWKFMQGNRQHNIATTIITGSNLGIEQIRPFLEKADVLTALQPHADYFIRYFFQTLGIAQYNDSSERLHLASIPAASIPAIEAQIAQTVMRNTTAPQNEVQHIKSQLSTIANNFTAQMSQIQKQQQTEVEACAIPVVTDTGSQLCAIIFTSEHAATHQAAFQSELTNALDTTCANIYQKLSGKGDAGRYLGGGCC